MLVEPNYPDEIIVLVKNKKNFTWYISDKELWILNLKALDDDMDIKLKELGKKTEERYIDEEREGLEILDQNNIDMFESRMEQYRVTYQELLDYFEIYPEQLYYKNATEILPEFYIDFDMKIFYSLFTEPGSYEYYIPKNWQGILTNQIARDVMIQAKSV